MVQIILTQLVDLIKKTKFEDKIQNKQWGQFKLVIVLIPLAKLLMQEQEDLVKCDQDHIKHSE